MKKNPLISIIVPVYNVENYLFETITSVINQTYKNWELLLIDDKSNDNTLKLISFFKNKKIKVFKNKKNFGPATSRNLGLKKAKGDYIAFLDSDDIWHPKKLKLQIDFMLKNKYNFVCTNYQPFKKNFLLKIVKPKKVYNQSNFVFDTSIATSSMMLKKSVIKNSKFKSGYGFDDYIFKYKLLKSNECHTLNINLLFYRITSSSISSSKINNIKYVWNINKKVLKFKLFKNLKSLFLISIQSLKKYGFKKILANKVKRENNRNYFKNYTEDLRNAKLSNRKVSIVMPVYNAEKTLKRAINSVVSQTYKNWELIIWNDGSIDKSKNIIQQFRNTRIKYYENNCNLGQSVTRNKILSKASGYYIAFLDSDDVWHKDKLTKQIKFVEYYNLPFSFCSYYYYINNSRRLINFAPVTTYHNLLFQNYIGQSTVIYKKNLFKNYQFSANKTRMDFDFWLNILKKTGITLGLNNPLVDIYSTSSSQSKNNLRNLIYNWRMLRISQRISFFQSLYFLAYHIKNSFKKRGLLTF